MDFECQRLRKIRETYNQGDFVSTVDLLYIIKKLEPAEDVLLGLGAEFHLARLEISRMLTQMRGWLNERRNSRLKSKVG